jgi:hypothetical protein
LRFNSPKLVTIVPHLLFNRYILYDCFIENLAGLAYVVP